MPTPVQPVRPQPEWLRPLVDAEAQFTDTMRGVRLIGELDLQAEDYQRLQEGIATLVQRRTANSALRMLQEQFPRTLAVYLVAAGIYGYDDGTYWTEIRNQTNLVSEQSSYALGQWFLAFLPNQHLETFAAFPDGALRYVSRILAHGGVPVGCLPDLFDHLAALLARPEWQAADARSLLDFWEAQGYATQRFAKPTERFLQFGGDIALNVLARVLTLMTSPEGVDPHALGLPQRIGDAWQAWVASHRTEVATIEARQRQTRLVAPRLECDPWSGAGPAVYLPEQPLPQGVRGPFHWRIRADDTVDTYSAEVYGGTLHAEPHQLRRPPALIEVSLLAEGEGHVLRTWRLPGVAPQTPALAFTHRTWQQMAWSNVAPGSDLNLVLASDVSISALCSADTDGGHGSEAAVVVPLQEHETYQRLSGAWAGYRHVAISIPSHTTHLRLDRDGGAASTSLAIARSATEQADIDLSAASVSGVRGGLAHLQVLHTPPTLTIPAADWRDGSATWTVHAELRTGYPEPQRRSLSLREFARERHPDGSLAVRLQHADFLPMDRACEVSIQAQGPLGSDVEAEFVWVPGLVVDDRDGAANVAREEHPSARIHMRSTCLLDVTPTRQEQAHAAHDGWVVFVPGRQASLELRTSKNHGGRDTDPPTLVHIPVAGMQWAINSGRQRDLPAFTSDVLRLYARDVRETGDEVLVLAGLGEAARVVLRLRDRHGNPIGAPQQVETQRHRVSLQLRRWATELAVANTSPLQITADVHAADGTCMTRKHLATILPDTHVEGWNVRDGEQGPVIRLQVHWQERTRLRARLLRLWHLDQPWRTPYTWAVPDEQAGNFEVELPYAAVLPGNYRFALAVDDPWALETDLSIPPAAEAHDTRLGLGADLRREWWQPAGTSTWQSAIAQALSQGDPALATHLPQPDLPPGEVLGMLTCLTQTLERRLHPDTAQLNLLITTVSAQIAADDRLLAPLWSQIAAYQADAHQSLHNLLLFTLPTAGPDTPIVRTLRHADLPQRHALEQQHPWLFLLQRGHELCDGDGTTRAAAAALLGPSLTHLVPPAGQILDRSAVFKCSALEPTEHWHYRYGRLHRLHDAMGPMLTGDYLGSGGHFSALFDWLLRLNDPADLVGRGEQAHWISEHIGPVMADLQRVRRRAAGRYPSVVLAADLLEMRYDSISSGVLTDYLPTICGCVALFQRLHARHPALADAISLPERELLLDSRRLATAAPALYERDLCLFDLLCLACEGGHGAGTATNVEDNERPRWR